MNIDNLYKQLTNVDIKTERRLWDERGKGYYGEYLVFCDLYKHIEGYSKILMNLDVPVNEHKTTEIDLLMIHETGLYVFEIKHYKGTIYGKDTDETWTQYFKTTNNSVFNNPVKQNAYHIKALRKIYNDIPIHSFIVFTNDECDIKVENSNPDIDICLLKHLKMYLDKRFRRSKDTMDMEKIDMIFKELSKYSKMQQKVIIDYKEATFFEWVEPTIKGLEDKKYEIAKEKEKLAKKIEETNKKLEEKTTQIEKDKQSFSKKCMALVGIFAIIAVVAVGIIAKKYDTAIEKNNRELELFKQNFLHVDQIDNEYITELNSYVNISNAILSPVADNAVSFTARIEMNNNDYGVALTEDTKYIVFTKSGKVYEYDMFGEHLWYNYNANILGKGYRSYGDLAKIYFYGINDVNEIEYIKITNINLFNLDMYRTVVKSGLEIELYSVE